MKNDHAVVLFDDGVYAVLPIKNLRLTNGHYSTKWKNVSYNVNLIKTATKPNCYSFVKQKNRKNDILGEKNSENGKFFKRYL